MDESFARELEGIRWFQSCGQPLPQSLPFPVAQVSGWSQALSLCSDQAWEDVTLEARNRLTEFLHTRHRDAYQQWNHIAAAAKSRIDAPVCDLIWRPFAERQGLGKAFTDAVSWDVLAAVMEHAYRDCSGRPTFFLQLLQVYRTGHFPCGWSGDWPDGMLLVW